MKLKQAIFEMEGLNADIAHQRAKLKVLTDNQDHIKKAMVKEMLDSGVKRVEHEDLKIQVVLSTRKGMSITNDVQALAILSQNKVPTESFLTPDKSKIKKILKELQEKGVEVPCVEETQSTYLTFKKQK